MARIELSDIAHCYAGADKPVEDYALKPMRHVWEDGGAYALLGPSGCGKTTLLNVISGLIQPTAGRVLFGDRDVTDASTEARNIAQVFQFPIVYDTMTVYDNLAFPLRNRGFDARHVDQRVREVAGMLELSGDLNRRAQGLTADGKQKISLGRGLVRSDVNAILFDEPLTVIDPQIKWHLRRKLKQVHEQFRLTLIYVTHDQNEALTFADKVAVMHDGRLLQVGTPQALFETPAHTFIGYFIGSPGMNLLPCVVDGAEAVVDGVRIPVDSAAAERARAAARALELGIRPEFLEVHEAAAPGSVPASLLGVEDLGTYQIVTAELAGRMLKAKVSEDRAVRGETVHLLFPPARTMFYADGRLVSATGADDPAI